MHRGLLRRVSKAVAKSDYSPFVHVEQLGSDREDLREKSNVFGDFHFE